MIDWLSPVVHFTFILIILSWQDWQTNLIQTVWLLWPISLAVIQHNFSWSTIILYILFLTLNNITDEIFIGNGDIDILCCGMALLPFDDWLIWLFLSSLLTLLSLYFYRNRLIPFVPFLTTGLILSYII